MSISINPKVNCCSLEIKPKLNFILQWLRSRNSIAGSRTDQIQTRYGSTQSRTQERAANDTHSFIINSFWHVYEFSMWSAQYSKMTRDIVNLRKQNETLDELVRSQRAQIDKLKEQLILNWLHSINNRFIRVLQCVSWFKALTHKINRIWIDWIHFVHWHHHTIVVLFRCVKCSIAGICSFGWHNVNVDAPVWG